MINQEQLFAFIERIYASVTDPSQWSLLLADLNTVLNSSHALFYSQNYADGSAKFGCSQGFDEDVLNLYCNKYGKISPTFHHAKSLPAGQVYTDNMYPNQKEYQSSEFYDYLSKYEMEHLLQVHPLRDENRMSVILFRRNKIQGHYTPNEVKILELLTPHFRQAFKLHKQLHIQTEQSKSIANAVEQLNYGVILVNHQGCIDFMNSTALRYINAQDGLKISQNKLNAIHKPSNDLLQNELCQALKTSANTCFSAGRNIAIQRTSGKRAYGVMILPRSIDSILAIEKSSGVTALIADPESLPQLNTDLLKKQYNLTQRETELILLLTSGKSTNEIAELLNISKETIRSHLKNIFMKTGVNSQTQLVQLLLIGSVHVSC